NVIDVYPGSHQKRACLLGIRVRKLVGLCDQNCRRFLLLHDSSVLPPLFELLKGIVKGSQFLRSNSRLALGERVGLKSGCREKNYPQGYEGKRAARDDI